MISPKQNNIMLKCISFVDKMNQMLIKV